ncbi:bifunctional DNA primase/polymerase [Micromonospora sp. NPDC049679]|uniref:bifunctional DNA primase/polymerase n=1 Tax=Micromonospora sp. NPDC049679 TaxID=3155920 RepID=UPI0033C0E194
MGWRDRLSLTRTRLRNRALRYANHGWEVTPGARLDRGRFECGRPGCPTTGCHPALEHWEQAASNDATQIAAWWRRHPHAVLLATGHGFDVLEVPAHLGLWVLGAARLHARLAGPGNSQVRGPVAVTPNGRWMFLVRPGGPLRPEFDGSLDVVRHGRGSWIPAPPTVLPEGPVRWVVAPEETRWQLPDSYVVQGMLINARNTSPRHLTTSRLPRPLPRLNRAT